MRRKTFLKKSKVTLYRTAHNRALRIKRLKKRKAQQAARHTQQFVIQEICC
ncbi:hypothetical protein [Histophilus somni]|uniref:Uncharacterized protein n=1 Tax=Histophilus somni TaxID=731 RepID=A0A6G7QPZ6_HISSO|nr:hypothetical protein [Histophilus somni]MBB5150582.1 hypothetical protein [Histophilus somni]QQF76305.1 hypothetical protein JFL52_05380 [Histophilus somni]QQF83200.1 hypothetical protein JFL49_04695 [Histophilus somni]QQF90193.1 hypothetical protein JFL57_05375 [Histophilus somni]BBD21047.1 hypothetical protein [Histophilus somni]